MRHRLWLAQHLPHIAVALVLLSSTPLANPQRTDAPAQTPEEKLVLISVTVTDKHNNYVMGLDQKTFAVFDNTVPRVVNYFDNADVPISIGILVDVSGSMGEPGQRDLSLAVLTRGLSRLVELSNSSNEYFLLMFAEQPRMLSDWIQGTDSVKALLDQLATVKPKKSTAFYDACHFAVERLKSAKYQKHVLVLVTDGQDNESNHSFNQTRRALRKSGALVYAVLPVHGPDAASSLGMEGQDILKEFAANSGGVVFFPETKANVQRAFETMAAELRHQYLIGFKPVGTSDKDKWHRINVKIVIPPDPPLEMRHFTIRGREGYYADAVPP